MFQDVATNRTIGFGHENDGLYILDSSLSVATSVRKGNGSSTSLDELSYGIVDLVICLFMY